MHDKKAIPSSAMRSGLYYLPIVLVAAVTACDGDTSDAAATTTTTASSGGSGAQGGAGPGSGGASVGGGGSGGASVGGGGSGGAVCAMLSDELDDDATFGCWSLRDVVEGTPAQYDVLDIDTTVPGNLVIEPTSSGWYGEQEGPFVYKDVTGDFVVEIQVAALDETNPSTPASDPYHSAGIVARDPSSDTGTQDWIMYDVGYQDSFLGTEGKTTTSSMSVLTLIPGYHSGRLRVCRVGEDMHLLRWLDDESGWTEEFVYPRGDLPATLQVGLITNAWPPGNDMPRNLQARFDYVRFGNVTGAADCTADFEPQ
jgi:hypothetical protein